MFTTKYIGPTNTRGSRVKATSAGGASVTLPWDCALNPWDNHLAAARALAVKLDMPGDYIGASLDGGGYVFIRSREPAFTV